MFSISNKYIYASDVYTEENIKKMVIDFESNFKVPLQESMSKIDKYEGKHAQTINGNNVSIYIDHKLELNKSMGIITDYFVEDVRSKCSRDGFISPYEYFQSNKKDWIPIWSKSPKPSISNPKRKYDTFKSIMSNGIMKSKRIVKECDTFPLTVPLSIYRIFKPKRILDMSAGWGDRLISAIMYKPEQYLGVDPNSEMNPRYYNIINTLVPQEDRHKYNVIRKPFEDVTDDDIIKASPIYPDIGSSSGKLHGFDMMFSSPPYFIAEKYSNDPEQSSSRYSEIEGWLNVFMFPSLTKIWSLLNNGGYLIFVINDTYVKGELVHYTDRMLSYIDGFKGAQYYGMMKYEHHTATGTVIQPIWIYRKVENISPLTSLNTYVTSIDKSLYDPEPIVTQVSVNHEFSNTITTFNVIREDMLIGGSKERISVPFLSTIPNEHIFYRGPVNGYAQVALAYGSLLTGKKFHMIVNKQKDGKKYVITLLGMIFGSIVHEIEKPSNEEEDEKITKSIISKYKNSYRIPLGLSDPIVLDMYKNSLLSVFGTIKPKTLWMTVSTGVIYSFLHSILPDTKFYIVFSGHKDLSIVKDRTIYFFAPEHHRSDAQNPPPYPSEISYDAKLWQFVTKYGTNGDYIFNTAGL